MYPFGYFASLGFTSDQLYPCVWEATYVLEAIGFYVRAFISDGASPNRKFYKIMVTPDIGNTYWTNNLLSLDRKIFFISDVPHLIKTTRNCFENSRGNNNTRNLFVSVFCLFVSILKYICIHISIFYLLARSHGYQLEPSCQCL